MGRGSSEAETPPGSRSKERRRKKQLRAGPQSRRICREARRANGRRRSGKTARARLVPHCWRPPETWALRSRGEAAGWSGVPGTRATTRRADCSGLQALRHLGHGVLQVSPIATSGAGWTDPLTQWKGTRSPCSEANLGRRAGDSVGALCRPDAESVTIMPGRRDPGAPASSA